LSSSTKTVADQGCAFESRQNRSDENCGPFFFAKRTQSLFEESINGDFSGSMSATPADNYLIAFWLASVVFDLISRPIQYDPTIEQGG
jgi:hypothetical protein